MIPGRRTGDGFVGPPIEEPDPGAFRIGERRVLFEDRTRYNPAVLATAAGRRRSFLSQGSRLELRNSESVVFAKNHNPTILNPDFLVLNKIVPKTWELDGAPVCFEPFAEVNFKDGIKIRTQFSDFRVLERLDGSLSADLRGPGIAAQYVATLPHVGYTAVELTLRGHIRLEGETSTRKFAGDRFIRDGPWKSFGKDPRWTEIKFHHTNQLGAVTTLMGHADWTPPNGSKSLPVVRFFSTFRREVSKSRPGDAAEQVRDYLREWKAIVKSYRLLIEGTLLPKTAEG
jgi:hypothetical protein